MKLEDIKVLVACEESQAVCIAFRNLGVEAYSCDLIECSGGHPEWHIQGDAINEAYSGKYNLMIGHPPCTYIAYSGMGSWNKPGRVYKRLYALMFFAKLWEAPIPFICLENPKSCASPTIAKYSQEIQPYFFGDSDIKTTWLWLKGLPPLRHVEGDNLFENNTHVIKPDAYSIDNTERSKKRYYADFNRNAKQRSKTFPRIAKAMAEQWTKYLLEL